MRFEKNVSLKPYNSFGIQARAERLARFSGAEELSFILQDLPDPGAVILGGGSNVLLRNDQRSVLINEVMGIEIVGEDDRYVYVKAGAGETWHHFVEYCIDRGWAGVENLSLIPGKVGAAPMQNIGAYGAELKDVFQSLEAFHLQELRMVTFSKEQCAFGYRESIFKNKVKGQFAIMSVTFRLNKVPSFNTSYGAIARELEAMGIQELTIRAVSDAVVRIRTSKLPDPKKIGNAGSFFKNPEVPAAVYAPLAQAFPGMVAYPVAGGYKLAAGWLIEQCGWKGFREGDAGVHANQALVLVNYGNASGEQLYELSERILLSVQQRFGVHLEREVNIL
jgi:UDP-N-acetylmuramate dehydrogenase